MDEKTIQRIKKLQALAERGVGGEKTTAQKKLAKLLKDNGINSLGIHGKGGEAGIKAIQQLAGMVDSLKQCQTPQEVYDRYLQITGYCKCCVDCNFIDQKGADA